MPAALTYPGVYVEEIPSGVRTIAGVSTSDTAFVDFFRRGPLNQAQRITSFGDFERVFGGLDTRSDASYAIQQYYRNGGTVAWVVRVAAGTPQPAALAIPGAAPAGSPFRAQAASPGTWGNSLQVAITSAPVAGQFNLFVREVATVSGAPAGGRQRGLPQPHHRSGQPPQRPGRGQRRLPPAAPERPGGGSDVHRGRADPQRGGPGGRLRQPHRGHRRQPPGRQRLHRQRGPEDGALRPRSHPALRLQPPGPPRRGALQHRRRTATCTPPRRASARRAGPS